MRLKGTVKVSAGDTGVTLPDGFPKDVPIYKGAAVVLSMTQDKTLVVHFRAPASVADGMKFYQAGLKDQGWSIETTMNMGETSMLSAKKADRQCSVVLTKEDAGVRIQVSVAPES